MQNFAYDTVVIGSGFGGSMTAIPLADAYKRRGAGERVLMLERGTWWTTPVATVQDKQVRTYDFLREKGQPVQFWSSVAHMRGFVDIFTRCLRKKGNEDGLELVRPARRRLFGLFGGESDGVTIVRASGVGGGSLVYSNITIRPPDFIFDDERWPIDWSSEERNGYFKLAADAIGIGILYALRNREAGTAGASIAAGPVLEYVPHQRIAIEVTKSDGTKERREFTLGEEPHVDEDLRIGNNVWITFDPASQPQRATSVVMQGPTRINTGLSNIATRIAGLDPELDGKRLRVRPTPPPPERLLKDHNHDLWLDRAREFQTAASKVTTDWGTVDSSINDLPPGQVYDARGSAKNFCQREGRCNVGCLPGARHTLNKQLMNAALGRPLHPELPAVLGEQLQIEALAEVDFIRALAGGGYEVHYIVRDEKNNSRTTRRIVKARQVIVAAGCLGTTEILMRSKAKGGLPSLSDRLGYGFSTNGDWVGFIPKTKQWISLTRGPVTTSYAHFHTEEPGTGGNPKIFHTVEDQGIPQPFAVIAGAGVSLIRSLGRGRRNFLFIAMKIFRVAVQRLLSVFKNAREQQDFFRDAEELTGRMMCVVAQGREESRAQFRLGSGNRDTALRVRRDDGTEFWEDPIYPHIKASLKRMAPHFDDTPGADFWNPLMEKSIGELSPTSIGTSHPLGGCRMGKTAADGVVDEYGRVFDRNGGYYPGLYISDASIIPTALGVNPSMTITALALRVGDAIIESLPPVRLKQ